MPLVSVLLPVYNGGAYLDAALGSILRQDYRRIEVIAIDDGSTDASLRILEKFRRADSRIRIVSRENRGLIASLNEGLELAGGELVARMDADDIAYPFRLSRQVAVLQRDPAVAICGGGVDSLVGSRLFRGIGDPIFATGDLRILSLFFTIFIHSTVVYNRDVLPDALLHYDARYPHAEDFDLFRRITAHFPAVMMEESLIAYRTHDGSVTSRHKKRMRATHLNIVGENLRQEGLMPDHRLLRSIAKEATPESVRAAADYVLRLETAVAATSAPSRTSYEAGWLNLFYFIYTMIADEKRPELTRQFLDETGKWGLIRRRERYAWQAGSLAPGLSLLSLAANKRLGEAIRYMSSVPASSILPPAGHWQE
ncbi:glycosyl transferase [Mesorhizobium sp. L-8-10]|uniref:glycosyltransferase family 2 protein n=1 Tax=Mesorhizobium sp. L-8-10 TaxID=2744523 RepID=UPI0019251D2D|nr:glycosyltransferase family A protein [Mesorhizobium sp. L-8-10]BCH30456.1 glycosyl transferase [Mesorhizobium sp. L-8-10]